MQPDTHLKAKRVARPGSRRRCGRSTLLDTLWEARFSEEEEAAVGDVEPAPVLLAEPCRPGAQGLSSSADSPRGALDAEDRA